MSGQDYYAVKVKPGAVALSDLAASGASNGQVATWNGTAWAPATPSGGGGDVTAVQDQIDDISGPRTTGSINVSTNDKLLTVASATGILRYMYVTIAGAGASGADLVTWVHAISGTSVTLYHAASTTVSGAAVTIHHTPRSGMNWRVVQDTPIEIFDPTAELPYAAALSINRAGIVTGLAITVSNKRTQEIAAYIQGTKHPSMICASVDVEGAAFAGEGDNAFGGVLACYDLDDLDGTGSGPWSSGFGKHRASLAGNGDLIWGRDLNNSIANNWKTKIGMVNTEGSHEGVRVSSNGTKAGVQLFASGATGSKRQWALFTNNTADGTLEFDCSDTATGNPTSAGTVPLVLTSTVTTVLNTFRVQDTYGGTTYVQLNASLADVRLRTEINTQDLSALNDTVFEVRGNQGTANFIDLVSTGAMGEGRAHLYLQPATTTAAYSYPIRCVTNGPRIVTSVENSHATGTAEANLSANRDVFQVMSSDNTHWYFGIDYSDAKAFVLGRNLTPGEDNLLRVDRTSGQATFGGSVKVPALTIANLPSASTAGSGSVLCVTNDSRGVGLAVSDGTNWRTTATNSVVTTQKFTDVVASAVAYWPCQEASGNLVDSIASVAATATGTPVYAERGPTYWLENAIRVSSGNHFSAGDVNGMDVGTGSFTIACWVRRVNTAHEVICGKGTSDHFRVFNANGSGQLFWGNDSQSYGSAITLPVNQWCFLALGRDVAAGKSFISVNGFRVETSETVNQSVTNSSNFLIGTDGGSYPFAGKLAGLGFWASALTDAQIDLLRLGPGK